MFLIGAVFCQPNLVGCSSEPAGCADLCAKSLNLRVNKMRKMMSSKGLSSSSLDVQDPVSHWAKFGGLYKRCGQRALISKEGDLVVRPSFLELRMHFMTDWRRESLLPHPLSLMLAYCSRKTGMVWCRLHAWV